MSVETWGKSAAAKRVLLGSAASIFAVTAVTAVQAADLPVKAKPVEYVKVCSLYGAGFWYVPGTDTCIKIGAYTKLDTFYGANGGGGNLGAMNGNGIDAGGAYVRTTNMFNYRNRNDISFDMRTQTEFGTLRSYIDIGSTMNTGGLNTPTGMPGSGPNAPSSLYVTRAFLQFAGITAGRMRSFFDMVFTGTYALASQRMNGDTSPNGIMGAAYTWQFGGGLSATLSLEDGGLGTGGRGRSTVNLCGNQTCPASSNTQGAFGLGYYTGDVKGTQMFDPVFNIRLDQGWGFVGFSAALHDASGGYYGTCGSSNQPFCNAPSFSTSGHPADIFGYALSAAFSLNNVFGMAGDTIGFQAVYSKGAVGYATSNYGSTAEYGAGNNVGLGWMVDGIYNTGTKVELTQVISFNGAYEHIWTPQWRTSLYGGMQFTSYDNAAQNMICPGGAGGTPNPIGFTSTNGIAGFPAYGPAFLGGVTNCQPNFSSAQVGTRTMWNPVPDVDVGVDFSYYHLNTAFAGSANLPAYGVQFEPGWYARAPGPYSITNQNALAGFFRIQRNFLY